ncbi:hypothetical protein Cenrod_0079 [Candidatus Symbiobacter mobilis CR]|uniref:Uncharacterized protein n=1 Tax=Candidatus Symbiobacter mobilis CR TaxID=946483 RepID=U5N7N8_9BURK|nr:hypothetical protein Cenrod_0079 [Candidatus Symbiobacter mobilis CR]
MGNFLQVNSNQVLGFLDFLGRKPGLVASPNFGVNQNLASPSGWLTCTCILSYSIEKKKKRKPPSRKIVGAMAGM